MGDRPIVSLCMPTNGVVEWVFPVLESIYSQGVDDVLFEVVVTDNGADTDFKKKIKEVIKVHSNFIYAETDALPFLNEIESYKRASGGLIKFVNHRTLLVDGALQKLIDITKLNATEKPVIYFANGVLKIKRTQHFYDSFDHFVKTLSYWSSWSTGMAIWKEDFERLPKDISGFNELFPHTTILFNERDRKKYVVDNTVIMDEIPSGDRPKGDYDLFGAFGIEYPRIIKCLLESGSISPNTYRFVLEKNLEFIASLYWEYCIKKRYCSYDISGLDDMFGLYYKKKEFEKKVVKYVAKKTIKQILRK